MPPFHCSEARTREPRRHAVRPGRGALKLVPAAVSACLLAGSLGLSARQQGEPSTPQPSQFTVYVLGRAVGTEEIALERTSAGHRVTGTGRIGAPVNIVIRRFEARYDTEWRPLELHVDATFQGQLLRLDTTVAGTAATTEVTSAAGERQQHTATLDPFAILLPNPFMAAYAALAARLPSTPPGTVFSLHIPPAATVTATVGSASDERIQTLARTIQARRTQLTLQLDAGTTLAIEIWSGENGELLRVSIPAQGVDTVREDVGSVTTRRVLVTRAGDEGVWIPATGFSLAGTISKPDGQTSRFPAVVLVSGSGPTDRDETISGIPIFGQLANALADAGFVVLRYDKRGIGQSGGRPESATVSDFADDLRAALRYLSRRKDVDRDRIAVLGFAEGAAVSMIAAAKDGRAKALILASAMGTSGAELNLEQVRRGLETSGRTPDEIQATVELQQRIQQAVLTGKGWEDIPDPVRRQADVPWFQSFLAFDPAKTMRDIDQPVLIVHGLLDKQIPPVHADRLAALALERRRKVPVNVVRLPGTNHLLVPAASGEVGEYPSLRNKEVNPEAAASIAGWLRNVLPEQR